MGLYYHFYVECRTPDGWAVPQGFEPEPWATYADRNLGWFVSVRWGRAGLFFGPEALFPMRQGPPEDRRGSPLFQYLDTFFDYEHEWESLYWLPYEELLVDCWDTKKVLARAKVPARYALLYGDGRGPFPRAELLAAGMKEEELPGWRDTELTHEAADMTFGPDRFRVSELPPEREVEVTWRETVSGFMGARVAGAFRRLRRYGPDADLRLLVMWE